MSKSPHSAIVTLAMGKATEQLDYTFASFAVNQGVELHAFILAQALPKARVAGVQYHLLPAKPDYSDPLREIYYRRMEVLDSLDVKYALTVDCMDVLCMQSLPAFDHILGGADVAACVEHLGCRYILGQGYTANFLNGGVVFWNIYNSQDIRREIIKRGRSHFRTVADDQYCLNEVIQTKYYERLRILPCQYNFRAFLKSRRRGWPTVHHLDGVCMYHNAAGIVEAKKLMPVKTKAILPPLEKDGGPLKRLPQVWRKIKLRLQPHIVK